MKILLKWFKTNSITANPKNFQFMILNKSLRAPITPNINDIKIRVLKDNLIRAYHWESVEIQGSRRSWSSSSSCKLHALRRIKDTSCLIKQTSFSLSLQTASLSMLQWYGCLVEKRIMKRYKKSKIMCLKLFLVVTNLMRSSKYITFKTTMIQFIKNTYVILATEICIAIKSNSPKLIYSSFTFKY